MLNKVILIGNLGADPDVRYMPNGAAVTNISVATSRRWKDKQTGEKKEETEWHRVIFFNRLAEVAGEYLKKGARIYIEGRIRTRKWQAQDGSDRWTTEIVAEEMHMLDRAGGDSGAARAEQQYQAYQGGQSAHGAQSGRSAQGGGSANSKPRPSGNSEQPPVPNGPPPGMYDDFDDDIPFMDMPKIMAKHHLI
jgi:single-strand DNA-binding protein